MSSGTASMTSSAPAASSSCVDVAIAPKRRRAPAPAVTRPCASNIARLVPIFADGGNRDFADRGRSAGPASPRRRRSPRWPCPMMPLPMTAIDRPAPWLSHALLSNSPSNYSASLRRPTMERSVPQPCSAPNHALLEDRVGDDRGEDDRAADHGPQPGILARKRAHTQIGARMTSSTVMSPASAAGMRRTPAVEHDEAEPPSGPIPNRASSARVVGRDGEAREGQRGEGLSAPSRGTSRRVIDTRTVAPRQHDHHGEADAHDRGDDVAPEPPLGNRIRHHDSDCRRRSREWRARAAQRDALAQPEPGKDRRDERRPTPGR